MHSRILRPIAVAAALCACDRGATGPAPMGQLSVAIGGLPLDVPASVTITGSGGYSRQLGSSRLLSDVPAGTYTIAASSVTTGNARYSATPATQTVVVGANPQVTARGITYGVATATLSVNVHGLPANSAANVSVTDAAGHARALAGSATLTLLDPGYYTIASQDVQTAGTTYRSDPVTRTISLAPSASPATADVFYGSGSGTLDVQITGLDGATGASVAVTGPGGFSRTLTSSVTLKYLDAGDYALSAATVGSNLTTHVPSPTNQSNTIAAGATTTTAVSYGSTPLQLALRPVTDAGALTAPTIVAAPDGDARLFVVERDGRVRIIENGALVAQPFLDIRARVNSIGERGMLSMAFDPRYATTGRFYVYYIDLDGNIAVERFASAPGSDVAGASDGIVIVIPHGGPQHHGGLIAFGPDGMLYLGTGDGGCCGDPHNNAQNLFTLLGKLLRIDVTTLPYTIPFGNPFGAGQDARTEIWALGLRNPWRFAFDAPSGMLYTADVGQDAHEEVDVVPVTAAGLNYGWPRMEGSVCYNPTSNCAVGMSLTYPAIDYTHAEGCSVIGGYVYRGAAIPELSQHYLYSDYCKGWLRSFRFAAGVTDKRSWPGIAIPQAVSFGRDGAGELYLIAGGRVWKIVKQ